jgi:DNA-binding response OmpR family regulator/tRNA A-37 threonylcarbamoyl transferase component Bud32
LKVDREKLIKHNVTRDLLDAFQRDHLVKFNAFPIHRSDDNLVLTVAMVNPSDKTSILKMAKMAKAKKVRVVQAEDDDIRFLIEKWYQEIPSEEFEPPTEAAASPRFDELKAMTGAFGKVPPETSLSPSESDQTPKTKSILLIDDDQIRGRNVCAILEKESYVVDLTTSKTAHHTVLTGGNYDVALIRHDASIDRYDLEKQLHSSSPKIEIHYLNAYTKNWLEESKDMDFREAYFSLVDFFTTFLEERTSTRQGYTRKVSRYAQRVAELLGVKSDEIEKIKLSAYFYCLENLISTFEISTEELAQTQAATMSGSFKLIQTPMDFEEILRQVPLKFGDGKGETIPLGARIIRVITDFLIRSFEHANDAELIIDFRQNVNSDYDPAVMEAFFSILKEEQKSETPVSLDKTILLIDPDQQLTQLIKLRFMNEGFRVLRAKDGREALEHITKQLPDLILSEVMLPKLDGFTLMSTLQKQEATAMIPLVFLSGKTDNHYISQGLNLGAIDYITKPVNFDILTTKIKRLLRIASDYTMAPSATMAPTTPRKHDTMASMEESFLSVTVKGFEPGALVTKRYEIISKLGQGGMGAVYKAKDRALDEVVALKLLKEELMNNNVMIDRFKYEIKLARKITHPNVIRIHDFGEIENLYFISMEYCEGRELKELIAQQKILPFDKSIHFFKQMLSAMSVAHGEGIIHRDLKPGNMLITKRGILKILDFGLAKVQDLKGLTMTGQIFGTALYMSPEQAQGLKIDARSDIYALGIILYELLVGKPPFNADNPTTILIKHLKEQPMPPRKLNPKIPENLEKMVLKAIEKKSDKRYQSVDDMLAELQK